MALLSSDTITWLRRHQRTSHGLIALIWSGFFIAFFFVPGPIQDALRGIDFRFADALAVKGRLTAPNPDIVFLGIDDASKQLDQLDSEKIKKDPILSLMAKGWPWSREVYAAALDRLIHAGARLVIFDILFDQPRPADPVFKAALDRSADRVIVGCNFNDWRTLLTLPTNSLLPQTSPFDHRMAFVNFWPEKDGVIRRSYFELPYIGASIGKVSSSEMIDSIAAKILKNLGQEKQIPPSGRNYWFRYTGKPGMSFNTYSIYQLFFEPDWEDVFQNGAYFKDKIVMIGPHGNFQHDQQLTPFDKMDGAEIHLQALNALLHGELLYYAGDNPYWLVLLVTLTGFIAWLLGITMDQVTLKRVLLAAILAVTLGTAYFFSGVMLYSHGVILAAAAPFGTFTFTMVTGLAGQYVLEQLERARTRRFFERYVSPKVVREILDNPSGYYASLSGQRRAVTILFSDLRGFTSMTEYADSEQLVQELNEYLQEMTRALFEHKGILDKFIGDAVMAVWGSFQPNPQEDCHNAVLAGLAMQRELAALNVRRRARGLSDFEMGVGINHGEAIVGDIGSEQQMNFTVIGDSVNLASRLEGTTKEYGVGLLISETVEEQVRPFFHLQTVDRVRVKGRSKPLTVYAVHGLKEEALSAEKIAYLAKFDEALQAYWAENFQKARECFAACRALLREDELAKVFEERAAEYAVNPPPRPWDGAYTMTTK